MGRLIDLSGKRFGQLVVIDRAPNNVLPSGLSEPMWNCLCDCGNTSVTRGAFLRSGHTTSCGCGQTGSNFIDLTGRQYSALTVISRTNTTSPVEWLCICSCGREVNVRGSSLVNGHTKSCGCRKKQLRIPDMIGYRSGRLVVREQGPDRITPDGLRIIRWWCDCDCGGESLVAGAGLRRQEILSCGCYRTERLAERVQSRAEVWVETYLIEHGISFSSQKTFPGLLGTGGGLLSYDFAITVGDTLLLVECQGRQHYEANVYFGGESQFERQLVHDARKRTFAESKQGVELLEIPFLEKTTMDDVLKALSQRIESVIQ